MERRGGHRLEGGVHPFRSRSSPTARGCYTFPESKLDGDFALKILAVGDEFVGPRAVDVRPGVTAGANTDSSASPEADRRVRGDPLTGTFGVATRTCEAPAENLAAQLSNAKWLWGGEFKAEGRIRPFR